VLTFVSLDRLITSMVSVELETPDLVPMELMFKIVSARVQQRYTTMALDSDLTLVETGTVLQLLIVK
jgi:hypothetical protein